MSVDDDRPVFACRCLNIRLYASRENRKNSQEPLSSPSSEYQPLYVGEDGIKISHNELTLRTRFAVSQDSSSASGHSQQTLVTCLVCDTPAYRVKADVPPDEDAKQGPVLPTEDWAERNTLMSRSGLVDVHVGKGGCIAEEEIRRIASSTSYSQYFSLSLPSESHTLSTAPPPVLPPTRLGIPASHAFLPSLPPFLPPPPFTPSHPIFLHLSSIATASSNDARRDTEKRIEDFAKQQLAALEEHETKLKTQLEHLWKIVKEALKKAEQERDASLLSALQSRRRSMSPRRVQPSLSGVGSPVVRNFVPSSYHAPRAVTSSNARQSALSASLATSSFHHPRAQQESNIRQTSTTVPAQRLLTPSPPPYTSNPSSSSSSTGSGTGSIAELSRSLKRNMDASNDIAATHRWYVIEEQEAARRKAREKAEKDKENKTPKDEKEGRDSNKSTATSGNNAVTTRPSTDKSKGQESLGIDDKRDSPRKKDGRRKVTFNVEPNVVTIKRNITAESEQGRTPDGEEDLLFDMDGVEFGTAERTEQTSNGEDIQKELPADITFREVPDRSQRPNRRQHDLKDAGLPQSFAALRPSSLPAPSSIRPPIRSQTGETQTHPRLTSPRMQRGADSSRARDINRQASERRLSQEVLSPEQRDLLKRVAADSPSHRGLWRPGSDAWKIFDRNGLQSSQDSTIAEEDEQDESTLDPPVTNGKDSELTDWRYYKQSDMVGSLPIPMAQHLPGSAPSLKPKTSLTDRPGALVPPLPSVAEEGEGQTDQVEKRSAAAIRKQVYAERNKKRSLDPGVLDFVDEEDGDENASPDNVDVGHDDDEVDQVSASRSRQHALEIIKLRNRVPPEGFWRSLAD
ncbi:uncharacterized protein FOMMEDRAFT_169318 [Fomitiporia mediterranea MF3/22]|uniref:uncharacterized protein n=1 Tax=Fomitiporia mediterranea (strain MF3/22) TaxID=694068 RepID=UPI000440979F|nr:uncharacterized protein FOMMEDRAFT_169318 [Fomitiporia mediterranea MF3/22]EJD01144.1 hypothetical protein FOMMEDRAFT_169318 [Fomitiporia mediterranea MF3/22]